MNNIIVPITALPELTENIKRAIGLSLWRLIQVECEIEGAKYLLQTPEQSFILNEDGSVIKALEATDSITEVSRVFFEGYSFPSDVKLNSISNTICK